MPEKRGSPLNNPLPRKAITNTTSSIKTLTTGGVDGDGRKRGVWQGGEERVKAAEAILKCPHCGRECKIVFACGRPPNWVKCTWCGELQPADGYRVIAYGLGLPRPLAPHEVQDRAAYLESLRKEGIIRGKGKT